MVILGLDVGSSSVKAAIIRKQKMVGRMVREPFDTSYDGVRAEIDADTLLRAIGRAIRALGSGVKKVDAIAPAVLSPSWLAMDKRGRAITPIVTHQDRRSVEIARELEAKVGKARHLKLAGNRPYPGGISSTTWAWFLRHAASVMKRADLCGHASTFLHRVMTNARVTDPSNAAFMGFYAIDQSGWSDELMEAVGIKRHRLPQVIASDGIAGMITRSAGERFGLTHGTPMVAGMVDTGAAMLLAGARPGTMINVSGSTDVLAVCVDRPRVHEKLLTRPLGTDRRWLSVATLAAAGATMTWVREQLFPGMNKSAFWKLVSKVMRGGKSRTSVRFEPYLAGDRMSMEQRQGSFAGLTLATTRDAMLAAVVDALVKASAERFEVLREAGVRFRRDVLVSGGVQEVSDILQRDWPGKWKFRRETEATLRGLGYLVPMD